MEQPNRILNLLSEGFRPSKIVEACNTPIALVVHQITDAINKHQVLRSRVLATLESKWQDELATWFPAWKKHPRAVSPEFIHEILTMSNSDDFDLDIEEVRLYLLCFEKGFTDGEMYEALCDIERTLHSKIRMVLIVEHGPQESGWWRIGVPKGVRLECVALREGDSEFDDNPAYSYTTLGQLGKIIEHNKDILKHRLPLGANGKTPNMEVISKDFSRLTKIRNRVMHPIGATPPTEEEFTFVKQMQAKFDLTKWR
jgi:hypothetical protein